MQQTPRTNPATKSRPRYEDVIVKDFSNEPFLMMTDRTLK